MQRKSPRLGGLLLSLLVLVVAVGAVVYRQHLIDWWQLRNYNPPAEIAQLADDSKVTDYGRKVFYVAHPRVEDSKPFNEHCGRHAEKTIVLGCYDGRHIYIYNVTEKRLAGVKQVTAMHEMLHAGYDRLSKDEKQRVNGLLRAQLEQSADARVKELIAQYQKSEPKEIDNELHSILPTEVEALSPELETYYSRYFTNRKVVVSFAKKYESVFTASQKQIEAIDVQLESLKVTIEANEQALAMQQQSLEAEAERMSTLRSSGDIDSYNAAVAPYNAQVNAYNAKIAATKALVARYNALVEERNQKATAHNNLAGSLNSNFQPIPAR